MWMSTSDTCSPPGSWDSMVSIFKVRRNSSRSWRCWGCGKLFQQQVEKEAHDIGEPCHIGQLNGRPFPAAGLAADDSQGAHTLHGQHIKYHQGDACGQGVDGCAVLSAGGTKPLLECLVVCI